jgi:ABC-2 type transport system ATP-binding protein
MTMDRVLVTENLSFRYGHTDVVSNVSLTLKRGDIFGFVGPNGAGKTTTIKLMLGLLDPHSGTIEVLGMSMRNHRLAILRRVGALVETPSLYPHLTAEENLRIQQFIHGVPRKNIDQVLKQTSLYDSGSKTVRHFSLGMKQRLGIAMALLHNPELLILDEPANGLDPVGIQELRLLLKRLAAVDGLTVFISSHILSELEQTATKVAVISQGSLKYQGTLEELRLQHRGRLLLAMDDEAAACRLLISHGCAPAAAGAGTLGVEISAKEQIARLNELLVTAGIKVYRLSFEQPNLEEIFLKIVRQDQGRTEL